MDEARLVRLPPYRVVRLPYRGPRPPAGEFFAHWRALHRWAAERGVRSVLPDVEMIGYEPPGGVPTPGRFEYEACLPIGEDAEPPPLDDGVSIGWTPGGEYVLCTGELREFPELYRAARRYAVARGLAMERGGIEFYRPHPADENSFLMDIGVHLHG